MSTKSNTANDLLDALKERITKEIVKENKEKKKDEIIGSEDTVDGRGAKRKIKEKKEEDADDEAEGEGEGEEKPRKKKKRSRGPLRDTKDQQYVITFSLFLELTCFKSIIFSSTSSWSTLSNVEAMDCSDDEGEIERVEADDDNYLHAWLEKLTLDGRWISVAGGEHRE